MTAYIIRRLALIVPTLIGIMLVNFVIVQLAPGGPVEQAIAELTGQGADITERVSRGGADALGPGAAPAAGSGPTQVYRGAQGLDPAFVAEAPQGVIVVVQLGVEHLDGDGGLQSSWGCHLRRIYLSKAAFAEAGAHEELAGSGRGHASV